MVIDPWSCGRDHQSASNTSLLQFEDNFTPAVRYTLPDSDQYLAILEKKLHDIKNDPNVLQQLREKREACMQNLLNSEPHFEENADLDLPLANSQLLRTLAPQRQGLSKGEIVGLVHYDHLDSDSE